MTTLWQEALERLQGNDLLQLGMDADAVRQTLWRERVVTYSVGVPLAIGGAQDWLIDGEAALGRGARGFVLHATPGATLDTVSQAIGQMHARLPEVVLTGFSAETVLHLSAGNSVTNTLEQLFDNGLAALGASGPAGELDAEASAWLEVHAQAHAIGLPTIAAIPLRSHESPEQWVARLEAVARLQAETQGFLACEPRIEHMDRALDEVTGAQYLKFVSLARIYLAHAPSLIPHIQADWSIFGPKVLQLALRFGADDAGLVVASARDRNLPSHHSGEEELRRIIRDAGFTPVERDAVYARQFVY